MSIILLFGLLPGWLQILVLGAVLMAIMDAIANLARRAINTWLRGRGVSKG